MIVVELQAVTPVLQTIQDLPHLLSQFPTDGLVLAQHVDDPDVLGQMQAWFSNFVKSGQVWALLIGIAVGYVFRGMTSF